MTQPSDSLPITRVPHSCHTCTSRISRGHHTVNMSPNHEAFGIATLPTIPGLRGPSCHNTTASLTRPPTSTSAQKLRVPVHCAWNTLKSLCTGSGNSSPAELTSSIGRSTVWWQFTSKISQLVDRRTVGFFGALVHQCLCKDIAMPSEGLRSAFTRT